MGLISQHYCTTTASRRRKAQCGLQWLSSAGFKASRTSDNREPRGIIEPSTIRSQTRGISGRYANIRNLASCQYLDNNYPLTYPVVSEDSVARVTRPASARATPHPYWILNGGLYDGRIRSQECVLSSTVWVFIRESSTSRVPPEHELIFAGPRRHNTTVVQKWRKPGLPKYKSDFRLFA